MSNLKRNTLGLLLAFTATICFAAAGDRYIENPTQDKDVYIQVNKGGVKTTVLKANGASGRVELKGDTSGVSVATGYVGEKINGTTISSSVSISGAGTTVSSITLTPGKWLLKYNLTVFVNTGSSSGNRTYGYFRIRDSGDTTTISDSTKIMILKNSGSISAEISGCLSAEVSLDITSTTTYLLRGIKIDSSGVGTVDVGNSNSTDTSQFYALRVN